MRIDVDDRRHYWDPKYGFSCPHCYNSFQGMQDMELPVGEEGKITTKEVTCKKCKSTMLIHAAQITVYRGEEGIMSSDWDPNIRCPHCSRSQNKSEVDAAIASAAEGEIPTMKCIGCGTELRIYSGKLTVYRTERVPVPVPQPVNKVA